MNSRIELYFGNGSTATILNLRSGELVRYTGGEDFHARYGGRRYNVSLSGLSGSGWIPAFPWLKLIGSYRTDVSTGSMFFRGVWQNSVNLPNISVFAPFNYTRRDFRADEYPTVVIKSGKTYLLNDRDVIELLAGRMPQGESREFEFEVIRSPGATPEYHEFSVFVGEGVRNCRRVVEALHFDQLEWTETDNPRCGYTNNQQTFWNRLGLRAVDGRLYKVAGGICRAVYNAEDLDSAEALQAVAPANVAVLRHDFYLQETVDRNVDNTRSLPADHSPYVAVANFVINGECIEDLLEMVDFEEGVRCMQGDFAELSARLEVQAQALFQSRQRERERQRQSEVVRHALNHPELRGLEQFADVEVTDEEIRDVVGDFDEERLDLMFDMDRRRIRYPIKVLELSKKANDSAVRKVLLWVLNSKRNIVS